MLLLESYVYEVVCPSSSVADEMLPRPSYAYVRSPRSVQLEQPDPSACETYHFPPTIADVYVDELPSESVKLAVEVISNDGPSAVMSATSTLTAPEAAPEGTVAMI